MGLRVRARDAEVDRGRTITWLFFWISRAASTVPGRSARVEGALHNDFVCLSLMETLGRIRLSMIDLSCLKQKK